MGEGECLAAVQHAIEDETDYSLRNSSSMEGKLPKSLPHFTSLLKLKPVASGHILNKLEF